jgi:hypothetical protein
MSKNGGKQSIFATTQVEIFIVIIFILLAISHVSMNESNEKNETLDSLNAEIEKSLAYLDSARTHEAEQVQKVTELESEIRRLKGDPPCRFDNGDQVLFRVQFLPGKNYHFIVQDYVSDIALPHFQLQAGYTATVDHREFSKLLKELYQHARDFEEPCRYVFKRFDPNNEASGFVGQEPLDMIEFVNRYMYQRL